MGAVDGANMGTGTVDSDVAGGAAKLVSD